MHKADSENYRPISLLSLLGEIFERLISWYTDQQIQLPENQYGCCPLRASNAMDRLALHRFASATSRSRVFAGVFSGYHLM
jgi:hypothetical protein